MLLHPAQRSLAICSTETLLRLAGNKLSEVLPTDRCRLWNYTRYPARTATPAVDLYYANRQLSR